MLVVNSNDNELLVVPADPTLRENERQQEPTTFTFSRCSPPSETFPAPFGGVGPSLSVVGAYRFTRVDRPVHPFFASNDGDDEEDGSTVQDEDEDEEVIPCSVTVVGNLRQRRDEFQEKLQIFSFDDFEGLEDFMESHRQGIENNHPPTLKLVHQRFQAIVQHVIIYQQLYHSILGQPHVEVALYATPNVRLKPGKYATFIHNDALLSPTSSTRAVINVWIPLNDTPPTNQLAFYISDIQKAHVCIHNHRLVGLHEHVQGETLVYDSDMCWGSFYCFVAGEQRSTATVLLHGAVNVPSLNHHKKNQEEHRKSVELRYIV